MPTGACGVQCDVCRLHRMGICSTCGAGTSSEGQDKLAAQKALFGSPCPVLACAVKRHVGYCLRDCNRFPCEVFRESEYPFAGAFLDMQERRRREGPTGKTPSGEVIKVPMEYWEQLRHSDPIVLCENTLARPSPPNGFLLRFLGEDLLVDTEHFSLRHQLGGRWERFRK